jgi:hypothetical protein
MSSTTDRQCEECGMLAEPGKQTCMVHAAYPAQSRQDQLREKVESDWRALMASPHES